MQLEHAAGYDRAIVETAAGPPRRGRAVSEAIVSRFVTGFDAIAIFGAGIAAMHWDPSAVDWRLNGLVVLLGAVLGVNFLHLAGAHRFDQFGDLGRRHRPCLARLAADAGHALPRHLPDRAPHGDEWTRGSPYGSRAVSCCW